MPTKPSRPSHHAEPTEYVKLVGVPVPAGDLDGLFPALAAYSLDEVNAAADTAIAEYKRRQIEPPPTGYGFGWDRFSRRYIWNQPLWYQRGRDAWIDDSWWIESAKSDVAKNEWLVNSLEILLDFGFSEYRAAAAKMVEDWYAENRCDPEDFIVLMTHLYPDHPIAREYVDGFAENELREAEAFLLNRGDARAVDRLVGILREELQAREEELRTNPSQGPTSCDSFLMGNLRKLGRRTAMAALSPDEIGLLHALALIAARGTDPDEVTLSSQTALECALEMAWLDVAAEFQRNVKYARVLLARQAGHKREQGSPRLSRMPWQPPSLSVPDTSAAALVWSLVLPGDFAARLAVKSLVARYNGVTCFNNVLAGAIAWKRYLAMQSGATGLARRTSDRTS